LVIEAFGEREEVGAAYRQARDRFRTVLRELVEELPQLRKPVGVDGKHLIPTGPTAQRMVAAVSPHRDVFVTPMAAVAGSVADEVMDALVAGRDLNKAYINNSGDIAVHLTPGETLRLGIVGELFRPTIDGTAELTFEEPVRGVATSGWQGRSLSFGIADAVTVLAKNAAAADVAATLIANAVNVDHPAIERMPARDMEDQSDLGDRLVTVGVGDLDHATVDAALATGYATAKRMEGAGLIAGAVLVLKKEMRATGTLPSMAQITLPVTA
jgi:ApbE superfamily uncharacterized protein (UPF0280 family)